MKQYFILILLVFSTFTLTAQNTKMPDFGKVDVAELQLKECSFDKNSGAMVLFSEGESLFKLDLNAPANPIFTQTEYHAVINIISPFISSSKLLPLPFFLFSSFDLLAPNFSQITWNPKA